MFIARDAGDVYNILATNVGIAEEKSIYVISRMSKDKQAEEETLG